MESVKSDSGLEQMASDKIKFGEELINSVLKYSNIEGIQKLQKKISQELSFLKKVHKTKNIKKEHLQCSNLTHFAAVVESLHSIESCISVNKIFYLDDRRITVDIISDGGLLWIKVVARNPKSISQISSGESNYGVRSVLDQANEFLECAQLYPCLFRTPKVKFIFANGIGHNLAVKLESLGIVVEGHRLQDLDYDAEYDNCFTSELSPENISHVTKANLDVSAMLAYVSSVTNGSCNKYKFSVPVLTQQAEWESKKPVRPLLDAFFKDKKLYCCETARNSFQSILNTVGGPNEKIRGEQLLKKLIVLPDYATAADTEGNGAQSQVLNVQFTPDKHLSVGGKIRERSLIVFTFGDRIQATTVTSNDGFVRAARQQGINFVVFVHGSRALTEQKESKAVKIDQ